MSKSACILFLSSQPWFEWRGSPIRAGFDLTALHEAGFDVDFVTLPVGNERLLEGVNIVRVSNPLRIKKIPIGPSPQKLFFDCLIMLRAIRLLRSKDYVAIHGIEDAGIVAWLCGNWFKLPFVFEKHSDPGSHRGGGIKNFILEVYSFLEQRVIRSAAAVIGTGPGLEAQARAVGAENVYCIPDIPSSLKTATEKGRRNARERLCPDPGRKMIVYVGSFAAYQGIDLLFSAIPHVVQECPEAFFVIIGGNSVEVRRRTAQMQAEGAGDAVVFPGHIPPDDLPDVLAAADLLLSPRLSGVNTPLKLLDYLKAGQAIIATDTSANRLILSENNAVLTATEPISFARGIITALRDDALRCRLAQNGKNLIETIHNYQEFKRRIVKCYDSLPVNPRAGK